MSINFQPSQVSMSIAAALVAHQKFVQCVLTSAGIGGKHGWHVAKVRARECVLQIKAAVKALLGKQSRFTEINPQVEELLELARAVAVMTRGL